MDICREASPALTTLAPNHRVACFAASPLVKPSATAERPAGATSPAALSLVQ
jgi:peptide/nickel transport system ATP-binding protein